MSVKQKLKVARWSYPRLHLEQGQLNYVQTLVAQQHNTYFAKVWNLLPHDITKKTM